MKSYRWSRRIAPHTFLTSTLGGGQWLTSLPCCFAHGKGSRYLLNRRLCGPQSLSIREENNFLPLPGFETGSAYTGYGGTAVAQWLRCCDANRKVAGSIPAGVSVFFIEIKSFRSHYGPGVDSAFNRNEYREYFLGVKAAGA